MNILPRLLFLLLVSFTACGPLIELEDENAALTARVDSLEIALAECGTQTDLAHERLSAIERENLQLDDNNRQLAAQIAEMRYASPSPVGGGVGSMQTSPTDSGPGSPGDRLTEGKDAAEKTVVTQSDAPVVSTARPSSARSGAPPYDHAIKPDLAFLREYQAALSAFNGKQYDRARQVFAGLLQTSKANDMIDNCVYWLGETAVQQGQQEEAHELFSTVLGYPQSDKAPQALLARARVFLKQKRDAEARADCQRILRVYPHSDQVAAAKEILGRLK